MSEKPEQPTPTDPTPESAPAVPSAEETGATPAAADEAVEAAEAPAPADPPAAEAAPDEAPAAEEAGPDDDGAVGRAADEVRPERDEVAEGREVGSKAPQRLQEGAIPAHLKSFDDPAAPVKSPAKAPAGEKKPARRTKKAAAKKTHKPVKLVSRPAVSRLPELPQPEPDTLGQRWYVIRVQAGRENRVRKNLERRIKEDGLSELVSRVEVPTQKVTEIKAGKKRTTEVKLYPGYVMIEMELDDKVVHLVRRTPGVGDFVGPKNQPSPMTDREVDKMMKVIVAPDEQEPRLKIDFKKGQSVKIKEGAFENFDGVVDDVDPNKGTVRVMVTIFGRETPIELEVWQVEPV